MAANVSGTGETDFDLVEPETCVLCENPLRLGEEVVKQTEKGMTGLQKACRLRCDSKSFFIGQTVHKSCRQNYCNVNVIKKDLKRQLEENSTEDQQILRSKKVKFDISADCLFCGLPAKSSQRKGDPVYLIRSFSFQSQIEQHCLQRGPCDKWAEDVLGRIKAVNDLPAADALYHKQCSVNFRTAKGIPQAYSSSTEAIHAVKGRPADTKRTEAFTQVAEYFKEFDNEQITITDLCKKMEEYLDSETPAYTEKHMRQKLETTFGDEIVITCIRGKPNVVTFRSAAEKILKQFAKSKTETDSEKEKLRIIKTAAELLLSDIKKIDTSKEEYPSTAEISDISKNIQQLPSSVGVLLRTLLKGKKNPELKIASLGQALMQAARPNVLILPLQLGLGVSMHHLTGSRHIVERLHRLGFSLSYNEVKLFEICAAVEQGTDLVGVDPQTSWIQFAADNVDHQIRTLDGSGTFHGMGIISAATPGIKECNAVRRDTNITPDRISTLGRVPVRFYNASTTDVSFTYEVLRDFAIEDRMKKLDLLWKVSWPLRCPRPGWSGMMQTICTTGAYPGQSMFTLLPMIDLDPTNMSCIYSTLHFITSLSRRYNCTPVLTFDQPLWWKSMMIVDNEPADSSLKSVVLRLGGFHCQMSFLGCMGRLMGGSGLEQVLEVVFSRNSVIHMLSGKSVHRAVRGHFLVDAVLNALIVSTAFNIPLTTSDVRHSEDSIDTETVGFPSVSATLTSDEDPILQHEDAEHHQHTEDPVLSVEQHSVQSAPVHPNLHAALQVFDKIMNQEIAADQIDAMIDSDLEVVEHQLTMTKSQLKGRTSKLWLQYMSMVDILRQFLRAERTGNWMLHLHSLQMMLPFLAAAGHSQYTKSLHIYLQHMQKLHERHPAVHDAFMHGHHVLRRSDRYWAGLSADLVIEQVLMRSVKSAGGLTRGRGMADSQRTQWLLSMPACADMNNALQEVTGLEYCTSDQHVEAGDNRQARDDQDMQSILSFLTDRSPFAGDESLRNVSTGVIADATVNVDKADMVGKAILDSMECIPVKEFKFSKKQQAVTMDVKTCAKVDGENIQVDPQLLFQRLVTAASGHAEEFDLPSVFQFELSTPPPSLFDQSGLLRESHKSALADAIATLVKGKVPEQEDEDSEEVFVLDGGSLLQKIPWRKGDSFFIIASMYTTYVCHRYTTATIVFDGYESGPSTKDAAHLRRSAGVVGPTVQFSGDTLLTSRKEIFLSNKTNKQRFITFLSEALKSAGVRVLQAEGDADTLIVRTALKCAAAHKTVVVGEDTDLLVLLLYHTRQDTKPIIFRSDKRTALKKPAWKIQWLIQVLGADVCHLLPFVHALNGCDTTSGLFRIGKSIPLRKLSDPNFRTQGHVFLTPGVDQDTIITAGEKALVCLYNGRTGDSLDTLRYQRFHEKVSTCATNVQIQTLPPTSAAAKYHSLRVYLQVQEWINPEIDLTPELWGWHLTSGRLEPRQTDLPPAPDDLLKVIRCNCKKDCSSKRCTCRKHGLECSVACGHCKGLGCSNSPALVELDDMDLADVPCVSADIQESLGSD